MIRHKPTFMALNAFVLVCSAFLVVAWSIRTPAYTFGGFWLHEMLYAALFATCLYNILKHVREPIEPTPFVLSIGERNAWAIRGTLLGVLAIVLIAVLFERFH
jgi:hypothetical protein